MRRQSSITTTQSRLLEGLPNEVNTAYKADLQKQSEGDLRDGKEKIAAFHLYFFSHQIQ